MADSALQALARLLVQQPAHIAVVALALLAMWWLLHRTALRAVPRSNVLWMPALLWLAYAAWEWAVLAQTPEADIRVDLLLIWPVVGLVTLWAFVRAARGWWMTRAPMRHRGGS